MDDYPNSHTSEQPLKGIPEPQNNQQESQPDLPAETFIEPGTTPLYTSPASIAPAAPPASRWPSILQFILSLLAILITGPLSLLIAATGLIGVLNRISPEELTPTLMNSAGLMLGTLLVVPSAYFSLARLMGWEVRLPGWLNTLLWPFRNPWSVIILSPAALVIGYIVTTQTELSPLLLPLIHITAAGIPILFLVYLGTLGKNTGSLQRKWGALAAGLVLGPLIAMILEITAIIAVAITFVIFAAASPDLMAELEMLTIKIGMAGDSEEMLLQTLTPYLLKPAVIASVLMILSVVVPLIEETFKPIAVWLLAGKKLTPSQGFAMGVISGSGFALYENLAISITGEMWATVMIARIGTALLHILTTGLTGWALASAWSHRRYLRLGLVYLGAVLIHGIWNGLAVLWGVYQLDLAGTIQQGLAGQIISLSPYALGLMVIIMFALLVVSSSALRREAESVLRSENGSVIAVD